MTARTLRGVVVGGWVRSIKQRVPADSQIRHWHLARKHRAAIRRLAGPRLVSAFAAARPDAFFIQIGANDGEQHDLLRSAILGTRWRGIMVEPVPYVFARLERNYRDHLDRITLENVAIAAEDGTLPFFHLAQVDDHESAGLPQWYDGIGSFARDHVLKHEPYIPDIADRLVRTEVPTLTFDSLCRKHGVDRVDLVQVDTEGYDHEMIKLIDFDRFRPQLFGYEHYHLTPADRAASEAHMRSHGYDIVDDGMDNWCVDRLGTDPGLRAAWDRVVRERAR